MIPCSDPRAQYKARQAEIDQAIRGVLDSGWYILGEQVEGFEEEFAAFVGADYGIGVASGTDALSLVLTAWDVGPGDEVITVSHTAVATVAAIERTGASVVFADIESRYYTMAVEEVEALITPRTRALVPVHLYGQPVDLDPLLELARRYGLRVAEDCAQAHGAIYKGRRVGSIGDAGCFSFYPTKNLGAFGDGGMIVTSDRDTAHRVRELRQYGWSHERVSQRHGWNSRLDELQAAVLRRKLRYLDQDNESRRRAAHAYISELSETEIGLPVTRPETTHAFHLFVVRCEERRALREHLREHGVVTLVHYSVPVHLQPAYEGRAGAGNLPETERAAAEVVSLPMYPEISQSDLAKVIHVIRRFG